jgi:CRP-like cAMP-binding protein
MSLLTGAPRSADVHVRKKAILLEIKKKDIEPILKMNEEIIERMSNLLAERMASNEKFLNDDEKNRRIDENKNNLARSILAFFFGATKKDSSQ